MKVKGVNKVYDVEVKKIILGKEGGSEEIVGIVVTCGNLFTGMTSVIISKEDWDRLKTI